MGADERADPLAGREQRVRQHGAGAGRRAGAAHTSLALPRPEDGAGQDGPRAAAQLPPGEAEDPRHPPHHELRGGEQQ